jgi:VCBS repeat-containing protein
MLITLALALFIPLSMLGVTPAWAVPLLTVSSSPRSFSPDGDGSEDTLSAGFWLNSAASVTAFVNDEDGLRVRSLTADRSYPVGALYLQWDGRDDAGRVVADGEYAVGVTAVAADGLPATASLRTAVDTRVPGVLSAPVAGSMLSGLVDLVVTPLAGMGVYRAVWSLPGCSWSQGTADGDGAFRVRAAVSGCVLGEQDLTWRVDWRDHFGAGHARTAHVPVTVAGPVDGQAPVVDPTGSAEQLLYLAGPGQLDARSVSFRCTDRSAVTWAWQLADADGAVVRSWAQGDSGTYSRGHCATGDSPHAWVLLDGRDAAGVLLPDGAYTLTATATDAGGLAGSAGVTMVVDSRPPAALTAPVAGSVLSGVMDLVVTPTPGMGAYAATWSLPGCSWAQSTPDADGAFRVRADVSRCPTGQHPLTWSVYWRPQHDPYLYATYVETVPVTVTSPPVADATAPSAQASVLGTLGRDGWFTSDVEVSWSVEDPESAVTETTGCEAVSVSEDTDGLELTCEAASSGGTTVESVTVKRDATLPVLECPAQVPGFLRGRDGSVTAGVSDAMSGPAEESVSAVVDTASVGDFTVGLEASDVAGNVGSVRCGYRVLTPPPPVAVEDAVSTDEDTVVVVEVLANDTDPHGDPLDVTEVDAGGTTGVVEVNADGTVSYDPRGRFDQLAAGEQATDTFTYTITDRRDGDPDGQATATVTVTVTGVDDAPRLMLDPDEVGVQHSDRIPAIEVSAMDVDSATVGLSAAGLPDGLSLTGQECTADGDGSRCTATVAGTVLAEPGEYPATIRAADATSTVSERLVVSVAPEDALVRLAAGNARTVPVARAGGTSGAFELEVRVSEAQPDEPGDLAEPGDPAIAGAGIRLVPVGPGSGADPVAPCAASTTGDGYDRVVRVRCRFDQVPVNAYAVEATVAGAYRGAAAGVLVVTDPSLGGSSGSGSFTWPDSEDEVSFAYAVTPNKKGTNLQGRLIVNRDTDHGAYQLRSNALDGLAVGTEDEVAWASFTGKATYAQPGADWEGNHTFTAYFSNAAAVADGTDGAWFEVRDKAGEVIDWLTLPGTGSDGAIPLTDGDVQVPTPALAPRKR